MYKYLLRGANPYPACRKLTIYMLESYKYIREGSYEIPELLKKKEKLILSWGEEELG